MEHALVKVTSGELYPYLKDITLCGRIETGESWGTIGNFYIYGCKDEDQQKLYKGILEYDKVVKVIGLQTVEETEKFWIDGCDGMCPTIKEGDYEVIESNHFQDCCNCEVVSNNDIKVYKMNDCEWWASKLDKRETLDFYLKEMKMDEEDNPIENITECDIDKEGTWDETNDEEHIKRLGDNKEIANYATLENGRKIRKPKFGDLLRIGDQVFIYISFRQAIEESGEYKEPYMIASTEY